MTVYISGPISGVPDLNRKAFYDAQRTLHIMGHLCVNPLLLGNNGSWLDCMIRDLEALKRCDAILFLPNWNSSTGCKIEKLVAEHLGLKQFFSLDQVG